MVCVVWAAGGVTVADVEQAAIPRPAGRATSAGMQTDANSLFGTLISVPPAKSCVL
ncbi:hypothetical protein MPRG_04960 [Mycobacterium paragordonae]|uniref:Uncharacterized protein n=1 Tax=Mycobacterium paragordonae TaxID=1389713 RepID=A0ABQ1BYJ9_9MYCO|nr:hypothetical protein MPRG_04960 [Mycobacterium paragordonae]